MRDFVNTKKGRSHQNADPHQGENRQVAKSATDRPEVDEKAAEALEFVVTEKDDDDREFVGGRRKFIDSEHEDTGPDKPGSGLRDIKLSAAEGRPHDESSGHSMSTAQNRDASLSADDSGLPITGASETASSEAQPTADTSENHSQLKKLSPDEVKAIEKTLYRGRSYLSDREREALIRKIEKYGPGESAARPDPTSDESAELPATDEHGWPSPKMAKKGRGVAYFFKNYVQIAGRQELRSGDELVINDRHYELRPKKANRWVVAIGGAVVFVLFLVWFGSQFVSNTSSGVGEIIGVALSDSGQPFSRSATVKIPELGRTLSTDTQGFFRSGSLPKGTHRIELFYNGQPVKIDYATVVAGKVTTLVIRPDGSLPERATVEKSPGEVTATHSGETSAQGMSDRSGANDSRTAVAKPARADAGSTAGTARIVLAANVDEAKLAIDGQVLGAGNLAYSNISSGAHQYTVSRDGFQPVMGTVQLTPGETKTLSVTLQPMSQQAKTQVFGDDDFYYSGVSAFKAGNFETAVTDLTEAITRRPSYAEAYAARADAHAKMIKRQAAYDDYVRAAEIFQVRKDFNQSISAYNKAVDLNSKSVTAYLGRANAYLSKNEELAAAADYEAVLKIDKSNAQAHFGLGEARFRQGQYDRATKHFKDARSVDSENPLVYQYLMLCFLATDDLKQVKKSYERFREVASEQQVQQLHNDDRYAAVLRVVETQ
ncbi:MAG TPA: tetratricopeptide repeat protein [Candidatus Deferrimicrobium sp.]|nr:tetratricopeptide repeat protein [Candidatus Deferrimicrobium sp.]